MGATGEVEAVISSLWNMLDKKMARIIDILHFFLLSNVLYWPGKQYSKTSVGGGVLYTEPC